MSDYPPPPPPQLPPMPPIPPDAAQGWSAEAYGSWINRVGGYVIDQVVAVPGWILYGIGFAIGGVGRRIDPVTGAAEGPVAAGLALIVIGGLVVLAINVWNRWIRSGRTGQTIGRQVMGLKLISEQTGQPIGAGMAFVRDLAHVVDQITCYIGWLFPLWDAKRQTLADKIMGTVVVNVPK